MSSTKSLTDRTDAVYRELKSMRRHFQIGSWITLIVGGLLLALVAGYFAYGYKEISSLKDPEKIVALVGQTVDDQIPIVRQRLESEVQNNATTWAERASQQVLDGIPPARKQIEQLALQQSDRVIAEIDVVGEKQFRKILNENRSIIQSAIQDLKNDKDVSEEVLLALQLAIEKELQIDSNSQADAVLTIVSDLNKNMGELLAGENLTREQKAERRVLMLAKRLQMETFGEVTLDDLALPPVVDEMVKEREQKRMKKEVAQPVEKKAAPVEKEPAAKPVEKKAAPAETKPAAKPTEAAKPAAKPKEAAKPAAKPAEAAKPVAKPAEAAKPAAKPKE